MKRRKVKKIIIIFLLIIIIAVGSIVGINKYKEYKYHQTYEYNY